MCSVEFVVRLPYPFTDRLPFSTRVEAYTELMRFGIDALIAARRSTMMFTDPAAAEPSKPSAEVADEDIFVEKERNHTAYLALCEEQLRPLFEFEVSLITSCFSSHHSSMTASSVNKYRQAQMPVSRS